ncbi:hypothetical protein ASG43_15885 [Aureimonas sp. Leaf454]|nr:hypothetical protein ASG43_15885 [Aureimonas sp. Leaf454]
MLLLGHFQIGYSLYLQHRLDDATTIAARALQLGSVQRSDANTADKFKSSYLCPRLGTLFDCARVIADSRILPAANASFDGDLWARTPVASQAQTPYCVGSAGEYMFLRISYPSQSLLGTILPASMFTSFDGKPVTMLQSFAALRIEPVDARRTGACT